MKHPFILGLDPWLTVEPKTFLSCEIEQKGISYALGTWCETAMDAVLGKTNTVKFQSAYFECWGPTGMEALQKSIRYAKTKGLKVILDAKRGDISSTMAAYGRSAFETLGADSLTVVAWMGTDVVEALLPWLRSGKSVFIVWLTSNLSGQQFQTSKSSSGKSIAELMYSSIESFADANNVASQIGYVLGATQIPQGLDQMLSKRSHTFLMPGFGAQGAKLSPELLTVVKNHPQSMLPVSRGLTGVQPTFQSWEDFGSLVSSNLKLADDAWSEVIQS
jgi:orotidine-5'-phosphate decarboxylase